MGLQAVVEEASPVDVNAIKKQACPFTANGLILLTFLVLLAFVVKLQDSTKESIPDDSAPSAEDCNCQDNSRHAVQGAYMILTEYTGDTTLKFTVGYILFIRIYNYTYICVHFPKQSQVCEYLCIGCNPGPRSATQTQTSMA